MTMYDIAKEFFDKQGMNNITPQSLADFLQENEWRIYDHYDKQCKRQDIMFELEEREIEHTQEDIENILDCYEDYLEDNDAWRDCLNMAIDDVYEPHKKALYSLNDFRLGDFAFDTAFADIRDKKLFDEFGNLIKGVIK